MGRKRGNRQDKDEHPAGNMFLTKEYAELHDHFDEEAKAVSRKLDALDEDRVNGTPPTKWTGGGKGVTSYNTTYTACDHDGILPVWVDPVTKNSFYAANARGVSLYVGYDYVIDCGNVIRSFDMATLPFVAGAGFEVLNQHVQKPSAVVKLDWKDMDSPPVGVDFWRDFLSLLGTDQAICVCCQGGHGRTGTCLASFMVARGTPAVEAIRYIRATHCKRAIETAIQENYLKDLEAETNGSN